jgi:hypothetical protein
MSERIRTRNNLGHVPIEEGISQRAHGGAQVGSRPARPPEPQEEPAPLRLPDMPQIPPHEKVDNEVMFTRRVLCAMIRQAVFDAKNNREYVTEDNQKEREANQRTAIKFLNSGFYKDLCTALGRASGVGLPADKITLEAMK